MPDAIRFLESVNFFPMMGIRAARTSGARGGWRLYVLAKSLDEAGAGRELGKHGRPRTGEGKIPRELLRAYAETLGVTPRQWQRWINEARNNDLFTDVQSANGEWMLILTGLDKAAFALGCETIGGRKVTMSASLLFGAGWRARVWAAYEQTHNGRNISRERLQKITNVPVSTQRYRDAQAGTIRIRSYAKSNYRKDTFSGLIEYSGHKGLFVRRDGFVSWRLPDSRHIDFALSGGKGCARKTNKLLRALWNPNGSSKMRGALSDDETNSPFYRIFNRTEQQLRSTEKKLSKGEHRIREIYHYAHEAKSGALVWNHIPI
jgi:hypothetical protein